MNFNTGSVSERAGVSVGTLYQYFPDKDSLVTAVAVRFLTRMREGIDEAAREVPARNALPWLVEKLVTFKRDNLESIHALKEQLASREGLPLVKDIMGRLVALFAPFVVDEFSARILVSSLEGALNHAVDYEPKLLGDARFLASLQKLAQTFSK